MIGWKTAGALLCAALLLFVLCRGLVVRRRKIKEQICQMELPQKTALLNELAEPFGFFYEERGRGYFPPGRTRGRGRLGIRRLLTAGLLARAWCLTLFRYISTTGERRG